MFGLDRLFANKVEGWRRSRRGFEVEVVGQRSERDVTLTIKPVGLPDTDTVSCRFGWHRHWTPYKGQISWNHSAAEVRGFAFDGTGASEDSIIYESIIRPRSHEELFNEILERDPVYPCESA